MRAKLSVVIITLNEERDLPACLDSVSGLDAEIIVLDSGSTDATLEIAKRHTPCVYSRAFDEYAAQKQAALDKASGDWVLSIDADERVSPLLREELISLLENGGGPDAYDIPFQVHFMGRRLRFGGLGSERHIRLFRRGRGRFVGGRLHEGLEISGSVGRLRGSLLHFPYRDLGEYLEKLEVYTDNAARKRFEQGRRFTPAHHLLPFWEFFARTVLRGGILDGTPGLVWAGLSSFHTWIKYVRLKELAEC